MNEPTTAPVIEDKPPLSLQDAAAGVLEIEADLLRAMGLASPLNIAFRDAVMVRLGRLRDSLAAHPATA